MTLIAETASRSELLKPYVPRLLVDWLRNTPDARWRAVDGSLAFVDISGFTKMTERLAKKGKVGAEELNDTLDVVFTELLSVAYDYGAGLVKWGGDAVLLLFQDDEHAVRAARAAAGMQRTLRTVGRIKTSTGNVTLRMSVGIHTGEFHFFLVGRRHRELVITGPAATRTVAMESAAEAGDVLLSPETASMLDPVNVGLPKEDGLLLKGEPEVRSERARPVPDVSGLDLWLCLPETIREHVAASAEDAEHRPIATAFIEFKDTDAMLEREGPDALAEALDELISAVQDAVHDHRVVFSETDISSNGGKILLIAGAPASAGDDEERMLRTARAVIEQEFRLPIRIGVNCGRVFTGDFGPPYRRTYSCKGDALNTAARIMGKAQPGQALATEEVLSRSRTKFEVTPVGPFVLKGKAQPVAAFVIGPVIGREARELAEAPLVGREEEMAALLGALESARGGAGRVVELIGDPGIGKSRLIQETRTRAKGVTVLMAGCEQYEMLTPYFPFRQILRGLLGIAEEDRAAKARQRLSSAVEKSAPALLPWLPLLGVLLDVEIPDTPETAALDGQFRRQRLEETVVELLSRLLPTATLVVIEDTHWMDEASGELLARLLTKLDDLPWLLLTTRRDVLTGFAVPEGPGRAILRPQPLGEQHAAALIRAVSEELPFPPHVIAQLAERSGGNPLFLNELVVAARDQGIDTLPDSVEALLSVQIDRLDPRDRRVLRYAAVLGTTFPADLLQASLEGDQASLDAGVWERLSHFVARDASGTARFAHALARDAAYEGLPYRRRQELHARVGDTIERLSGATADEHAEMLSFHFLHARRFDDAWRYSRVAADRAEAKYAKSEAAEFYRRALEAARHGSAPEGEVAATLEALGNVSGELGEYDAAKEAFQSARRQLRSDPTAQVRILLREAFFAERAGRLLQAMRAIKKGLRTVEEVGDGTATFHPRLALAHASVLWRKGKLRQALEWAEQGIGEAREAGDDETLAWGCMLAGGISGEMGLPEAITHAEAALALYEQLDDLPQQASVLNNLGVETFFLGEWDRALDLLARSAEIYERTGNSMERIDEICNMGEIFLMQGRVEEAEPLLREAHAVFRATGHVHLPFATREMARLAYRKGDFDEALAILDRVRTEFSDAGLDAEVRETDARRAECFLLMGSPAQTLELVTGLLAGLEVEGPVAELRAPRLERMRGVALLQLGRLDEAGEALAASLESAREEEATYDVALTLARLADLADLRGDGRKGDFRAESSEILGRLGVIALPSVPLPA